MTAISRKQFGVLRGPSLSRPVNRRWIPISGRAATAGTPGDAASPLRRCEYSLDATRWIPLESADDVIDSQQERFVLSLEKLTPGEHLMVIRVLDSANNAGLAKVVLH